ncbi:unnamed protein product [Prorocentrum cordatum]|uniref:CS domain-containing protein n=1 Tax=Prorocentrum cordatum TaxID=2364126 RepID=A0ABN9V4J3_9DINO|nr:unnamed protein product [Polarella glacialis]
MAADRTVFRLRRPGDGGGGGGADRRGKDDAWRLTADLGGVGPDDFALDLNAGEVRISFASAAGPRPPLSFLLPPGVPLIDVPSATCHFSRQRGRLTVSWAALAPASSSGAPCQGTSGVAVGGRPGSTAEDSLDERIAALAEECRGLTGAPAARRGDSDERLVGAVAAQVARLHDGGADPEHLASVVSTALQCTGRAADPAERSRLLLQVGHALEGKVPELRANCYEMAVEVLEGASAASPLLQPEACLFAAGANAGLGMHEAAEVLLRHGLQALASKRDVGEGATLLRARIHASLADVLSRIRPEEAEAHLQAAREACATEEGRQAERLQRASVAFAAPSGAERLPVRTYSVADGERQVSVRVPLDDGLYPGAASAVSSAAGHLRVEFDPGSSTAVELHIAAPRAPGAAGVACWVLRLAPLRHAVVPGAAEVQLRAGRAELRLLKEEAGPWLNGLLRD